ncbi:MAG: hypothetical protein NUK65_05785 [Firmicutes bacterium]|nr:hypothetical protein [Bacillota bacterium]
MIRLANIKLEITSAASVAAEKQALRAVILSKLKIAENELKNFEIWKKSIDARKKDKIFYIYTIDVDVANEKRILNNHSSLAHTPDLSVAGVQLGTENMANRPVIIGMGPAGLFAGLQLAKSGYRPVILERGEDVDSRTKKIHTFWHSSRLDPESNVQFGEGGAGTFSDGKLTTLINDRRCRTIIGELISAGAPAEILYQSKPHIGTDLLKAIVKNVRQEIITHGGDVRFKAKVTDVIVKDGKINALEINDDEQLQCSVVLVAIGHSARDTFAMLHRRGIAMKQKVFSLGVRIEHPQEIINAAQYGDAPGASALGAADYKLVYHAKSGRSAYTFCMCPGGYVVAAASEEQGVVTNGMSEYKRDAANANSALLVGVSPADFESEHPLAGIEYQRKWERLAYQLGGENYQAPVQLTGDFLADRLSTNWGSVRPSYKPGVTFAPLRQCLPDYVVTTLKEAIVSFDARIKGFAMSEGILTGVETRSSSPVRITRDEQFLSNIYGIYPMGEGAGYAGGIMSSAVDGVKVAEKVMEKYAPLH